MTISTSPVPTVSPAATRTSFTVPPPSALMWFSIFIASSTSSDWPGSTASPCATSTFTIVPCIGALTVPSPPAPLPAAGGGVARRRRLRQPHADREPLAVDLDGDRALLELDSVGVGIGTRRDRGGRGCRE